MKETRNDEETPVRPCSHANADYFNIIKTKKNNSFRTFEKLKYFPPHSPPSQ